MVYSTAKHPIRPSSNWPDTKPMREFLLLVHIFIAAAMIAFILLQKSEGGALGIGGGGGFMTGRGQTNFLTRVTAFLAAAFFLTSITLTILAQRQGGGGSILDRLQSNPTTNSQTNKPATPATGTPAPATPATAPATAPATPAGGGLLDKLKEGSATTP
jgi:preprotein translocase subunit SecG